MTETDIHTGNRRNDGEGIKDSLMDSLHKPWLILTNTLSYIPGFGWAKNYWFQSLNKKKHNLKALLLGELCPYENYQNLPQLTQLHENHPVVPKVNKIHAPLYQLVTQVLCRKHRGL